MFKKSANPYVEELTKSCRNRSTDLSNLKAITVDGIRFCAWCGEGKLSHGNQKYCKEECGHFAMAWSYPQKEQALHCMLIRQEWKCNICQYDYRPLAEKIHTKNNTSYGIEVFPFASKIDLRTMYHLKSNLPLEHRLEVDHIIPISKGGTSLGIDNHQAICYTCHKIKSKRDNSGPRPKK